MLMNKKTIRILITLSGFIVCTSKLVRVWLSDEKKAAVSPLALKCMVTVVGLSGVFRVQNLDLRKRVSQEMLTINLIFLNNFRES
jgi:hypothetical protein